MAMNQVQFQSGFDGAVHPAIRYGGEVLSGAVPGTLAAGLPLSEVQQPVALAVSPCWPDLLQCRACRHQTTLTSGTVFEGSKLPLTTWFLAMHLLTGSKTNMAALELKRALGRVLRHRLKAQAQNHAGHD